MSKAICIVAVCPMRANGAHAAEQVSQLVFGEVCEITDHQKEFVFITSLADGYKGWCQAKQLLQVDEGDAFFPTVLTDKWVSAMICNGRPLQLPLGSNIGFLVNGQRQLRTFEFIYNDDGFAVPVQQNMDILKQVALSYINTGYQWGGRTVFGTDCSGYTQMVYKFCGVNLLRDASQQATQGTVVDFMQEIKLGDLAFFDNEEGKITHVGIMLDTQTIIHASGQVRIDRMDQAGIINTDTHQRTHNLRIIKRMA